MSDITNLVFVMRILLKEVNQEDSEQKVYKHLGLYILEISGIFPDHLQREIDVAKLSNIKGEMLHDGEGMNISFLGVWIIIRFLCINPSEKAVMVEYKRLMNSDSDIFDPVAPKDVDIFSTWFCDKYFHYPNNRALGNPVKLRSAAFLLRSLRFLDADDKLKERENILEFYQSLDKEVLAARIFELETELLSEKEANLKLLEYEKQKAYQGEDQLAQLRLNLQRDDSGDLHFFGDGNNIGAEPINADSEYTLF